MTKINIPPLRSIQEQLNDPNASGRFSSAEECAGIDLKVQGFVRAKIVESPASLFVSAVGPKAVFISGLPARKESGIHLLPQKGKKKKKILLPDSSLWDQEPIGLMSCDPESWINALMQLVLRLPVFRILLSMSSPQSYEPFRKFMDQYDEDREAGLAVSFASGSSLIQCLKKNLSSHYFASSGQVNLFDLLQEILFSGSPSKTSLVQIDRAQADYWQCEWDIEKGSLVHEIKNRAVIFGAPSDLVVSIKGNSEKSRNREILKQIFHLDLGFYYDLQGFIEKRQDHGSFEWITYLKIEGKWYQCRNQRIVRLRSTSLELPLLSSNLLHYKRGVP